MTIEDKSPKMKVSDLNPPELDYWVARAEGYEKPLIKHNTCFPNKYHYGFWGHGGSVYSPSADWSQGGPIIEREGISVEPWSDEVKDVWVAFSRFYSSDQERYHGKGPTPLIAAMRAYVASKYGDTVER